MKHTDVAHVCWQDEVKSNRLRVRRVKSEDNLVDIGTKAMSNKIIRKHAISMGYIDVPENLKQDMSWGAVDRGIRASRSEQFSSAETSLESSAGHARQQQQRQRGLRSHSVSVAQW